MPISEYNPFLARDPDDWLRLDETSQTKLVKRYHALGNEALDDPHPHAVLHALIETQIATGSPREAGAKIGELVAGGLDRHEALHAVMSALLRTLRVIHADTAGKRAVDQVYLRELRRLSADTW